MSQKSIQTILGELGYSPTINQASVVFANAVDKIFNNLPVVLKEDIIAEIKNQTPDKDHKFPYYSLTKKAIIKVFGDKVGEKILNKVAVEISNKIDKNQFQSIEVSLEKIQSEELAKVMKNLSGHEHFIHLWNSKKIRNNVISEFFKHTMAPKGLISEELMEIENVPNITYGQILIQKDQAIKKEEALINETHQKNKTSAPTRLSGTDCTQWFAAGMGKEFIELERRIDKFIEENNVSCICGYNINEMSDMGTIKKSLANHKFVILDEPLQIFERQT